MKEFAIRESMALPRVTILRGIEKILALLRDTEMLSLSEAEFLEANPWVELGEISELPRAS